MILVILLVATVAVSLLLGFLAKLPVKELGLQTAAMLAAAVIFFQLVVLLETALASH